MMPPLAVKRQESFRGTVHYHDFWGMYILNQVEQSTNASNPIFSGRIGWLSAAAKTLWTQLVAAESNSTDAGKRPTSWLDTPALFCVNIFGALGLAHLLILIYMHENNFYAYDFVSSAGIALELMYIQFELIGLALAMIWVGSIPFSLYVIKRYKRLAANRRLNPNELTINLVNEGRLLLLLVVIAVAILILNIANVGDFFNWRFPSESHKSIFPSFLFALYISAFISIVYVLDGPDPKWKKSAGGFGLLFLLSIQFSEGSASLVATALKRARLGGGIVVTLDYSEPRLVSRGDVDEAILKIRKVRGETVSNLPVPTIESVVYSGERAFECISPAQGRLILDSPDNLYVQVFADPCDATDANSLHQPTPLFTQVIEKSKLRQYRVFRGGI